MNNFNYFQVSINLPSITKRYILEIHEQVVYNSYINFSMRGKYTPWGAFAEPYNKWMEQEALHMHGRGRKVIHWSIILNYIHYQRNEFFKHFVISFLNDCYNGGGRLGKALRNKKTRFSKIDPVEVELDGVIYIFITLCWRRDAYSNFKCITKENIHEFI